MVITFLSYHSRRHWPYHVVFRTLFDLPWFTQFYSYWTNNFLLSDTKHGFCAAVIAIYLWLKNMGLTEYVGNTTKKFMATISWCLSWCSSSLNEIHGNPQKTNAIEKIMFSTTNVKTVFSPFWMVMTWGIPFLANLNPFLIHTFDSCVCWLNSCVCLSNAVSWLIGS